MFVVMKMIGIESEYSKIGDFILDLYWSGCRGDWPSTNMRLTGMSLVQLTEP